MPSAESKKAFRTADLKTRTKSFALRMMRVVDALPRTIQGRTIANQIIRSATSVAVNYRVACRAPLDLIVDSALFGEARICPLLAEAGELMAIMAASGKSAIN
jgi:hypothetical protein